MGDRAGNLGGRPVVGPAFSLRFPVEMLAAVDRLAAAEGVSRAEWVRRTVAVAIGATRSKSRR